MSLGQQAVEDFPDELCDNRQGHEPVQTIPKDRCSDNSTNEARGKVHVYDM